MLTKTLQKIINEYIAKAFNNLRLNLLGPESIDSKSIIFSLHKYNPQSTLAANYLAANTLNTHDSASIDKSVISQINTVAENYIDSLEQKSIADVTRIVGEQISELSLQAKQSNLSLREVLSQKTGDSIMKVLSEALADQKDKIDDAAERIVNHEIHRAQNFGALDGILGANKSIGISDPTVFKILVDDEKLCPTCRTLWLHKDGVSPKLYKLSELKAQPDGPKDLTPSIAPQHINCFTDKRIPVLTQEGWKRINDVQIGDKVLTHTGKFQLVSGIINEPYKYKKNYLISYEYNGRKFMVSVTPDHKFLTQNGWVEAQKLTIKDKLVSLKYPCIICDKQVKFRHDRGFDFSSTCSKACHKKNRSRLAKKYHEDLTEEQKIIRASNCSAAVKMQFDNKERVSHLSNPAYWTKELRNKFSEAIKARMPHNSKLNKTNVIESVHRILNNHSGNYSFNETNIISIKQSVTGKNGRIYCLTVNEDESFISRGVVSHNCRCILTTLMPGFGFNEFGNIQYVGPGHDEYAKQKEI